MVAQFVKEINDTACILEQSGDSWCSGFQLLQNRRHFLFHFEKSLRSIWPSDRIKPAADLMKCDARSTKGIGRCR